jgi:hypothetical protein
MQQDASREAQCNKTPAGWTSQSIETLMDWMSSVRGERRSVILCARGRGSGSVRRRDVAEHRCRRRCGGRRVCFLRGACPDLAPPQ